MQPLNLTPQDAFAQLIPKVSANTAQKLNELNASLHGHNASKTHFMSSHGVAATFQDDALSKSIHEHHGHRDLDALSTSRHGLAGPLNDPLSRSRHGIPHPKIRASIERVPSSRNVTIERSSFRDPLSSSRHGDLVTLRDVEKSRNGSVIHQRGPGSGSGSASGSFIHNGDNKLPSEGGSSGPLVMAASDLVGLNEGGTGSRSGSRSGSVKDTQFATPPGKVHLPKITPDDDPLSHSPSHSRAHSFVNTPPSTQTRGFPVLSSLFSTKVSLPAIGESMNNTSNYENSMQVGSENSMTEQIEKLILNKSEESSPAAVDNSRHSRPDSYLDNTTHDGSWPANHSLTYSPEVGGGGSTNDTHAGGGGAAPSSRRDSHPHSRRKKVTLFGTKTMAAGKTTGVHEGESAGGSFWIDGERVRRCDGSS